MLPRDVIGKVEKWMDSVIDGSCKNRMMWLSGPAGAGKSAICQTIAERCPTRGQQAANFFFFRGDQTRNRAQPLVPTLLYQLRDIYPMLDELLSDRLKAHPLIFKASIEHQFLHLISSPMKAAQQSPSASEAQTIVLVIDGLDECGGLNDRDDSTTQHQILTALHALTVADYSPFLVLISSRAEPHLIMSFKQLGISIESIFLDEEYRPRDDIFRFVTAKFDEIKQVHHLAHMLSNNWPPQSDINAITDKSSGQFIYAATVMRFIQYSVESPDLSLVAILNLKPESAGPNPLSQLDTVYSYIFSKVQKIHAVKLILGASFIADSIGSQHQEILHLIGYRPVEINSLLAYLGAVIKVDADPLKLVFYHASLYDYLMEKSRSGDYHLEDIGAEVSVLCLKNFCDPSSLATTIRTLEHVPTATNELTNSLLDASTRVIIPDSVVYTRSNPRSALMAYIEKLYFKPDRKLFKILVQSWVRFSFMNGLYLQPIRGDMGTVALWYYRWYHFVEGRKFALKIK